MKTLKDVDFFKYLISHKNNLRIFTLEIEDRDPNWMYGIHNHAEFVGYMNPHDNCLWDALIPGYKDKLEPTIQYKLKQIIGVFLLENGNHKIITKIFKSGYNSKVAKKQVHTYMKNYYKRHTLNHKWVQIHPF